MSSIDTRLQFLYQCGWNAGLRLKAWLIPAQGAALGDRAVWFLQANRPIPNRDIIGSAWPG